MPCPTGGRQAESKIQQDEMIAIEVKSPSTLASFADEILRRDGRMNAAVGVIWAKLTGRSGFRVLGA
jgi:hypothetical protein